jgi:hypothetical protein
VLALVIAGFLGTAIVFGLTAGNGLLQAVVWGSVGGAMSISLVAILLAARHAARSRSSSLPIQERSGARD